MTVALVQAGAGSGKTYTITQELFKRLVEGSVRPEYILATTFTNAAAAELQDRIQQRLLRPEEGDPKLPLSRRVELATAIQDAFIGTVHSIGHQIVSRYAIQLGRSPLVEIVEEKAQERHLQRIFAEMPPDGLIDLDRLARRLPINNAQELVLDLLAAKRSNAIDDDAFREGILDGIQRLIQTISGGTCQNLGDFDAFYIACQEALNRILGNDDETKITAKARRELEDLIRQRPREWRVWGKVASLKWAKKSERDLQELTTLARRANVHAALHDDLRAFGTCLVEQVLALQARYRDYKDQRGLADFTDLEERFLELLSDERIRADLDLDLVVVDEFQDTNPIQLAIFQELDSIAKASLWVGDKKQAIYGFRGTEPSLIEAMMERVEHSWPLKKNWRANKGLVRFVNAVFTPIFGDDAALEPVRQGESRVDHWILNGFTRERRQQSFISAIQNLMVDERPGDVAILVRKNNDAQDLATMLTTVGVPSLVETAGLLSTREGATLLAGLRIVADPKDRLAAAIVRHVDDNLETPAWFTEALVDPEALLLGDELDELRALDVKTLPPVGLVEAVIQILRLPDRIARWGTPRRRVANLDALIALGNRYEDEAEQEGKAATMTGLIYWLEDLVMKGEDPIPAPAGVNAVTITTLWKAKGLEWPCVVLYQDGQTPPPDPFTIQPEGGNAAEGRPLEGRRVRYWPYPFGYTYFGQKNADGCGIQTAAVTSPEGQALAAAREEEAKRLLYVAFTRAKRRLIIAEGGKNPLALIRDFIPDAERQHEDGYTYTTTTCAGEPTPPVVDGKAVEWFDEARGPTEHPAKYWSPSGADPVPCETTPSTLGHAVPSVKTNDWSRLGHAVHTYLASLPALREVGPKFRLEHAASCLARWGQLGIVEAEHLVRAGERLSEWVEQELPGARWHVEVPVTAARDEGGQWEGTIDLLLETDEAFAVIDHKSSDWSESGWTEKAEKHSGQLLTYVHVLDAHGKAVTKACIHLPLAGGMVEVKAK